MTGAETLPDIDFLEVSARRVPAKKVRIPQPKAVREADALAGVRLAAPNNGRKSR